MKKNAIIIAGILAAAGASQAQQDSSDRYRSPSPSQHETGSSLNSTETPDRDARGSIVPSDPGSKKYELNSPKELYVDDSTRDTDAEAEYSLHGNDDNGNDDIHADSSVRGGSLEARGYDRDANNDELEGAPDPINPGKKADSSIRGGSIYARERNWNYDAEPSSGRLDTKRHMKADSSIRGGSMEARGGRDLRQDRDFSSSRYYHYESDRGDFGQGSSATWESDKAHGSVQGSANWNPSDDLMRDGMDAEAQSRTEFERDNDASVGGAARSETGSATLDDVELQYTQPGSPVESKSGVSSDLDSSAQLEENISGEYDLEQTDLQSSELDAATVLKPGTSDPNRLDTTDSSVSSRRSTDIVHGETDIESTEPEDLSSDISADMEREGREAVGRAADSESGSASSSDVENSSESESSFESKDPALESTDTPLSENDLNFLHRDNRAHGVGSLATGEFGAAAADGSGQLSMSDESLARELKARLTRESTGAHGMLRSDVPRNIQITAKGGEVTLTGTVPSEKDKRMIEIRALEMRGVHNVNNQLSVTPEADAEARNLGRGHDLEDRTSSLQD